ncbi:MAG: hypothetical protein AB1714_24085 [Acidobacteriota bacterium]
MKRMSLIPILVLAVCALTASAAVSQTLAEVAKQEREKRKDQKGKPAKTYTNADLAKLTGGAVTTVYADTTSDDLTAGAGDESAQPAAEDEKKDDRGETYWRARAEQAREEEARAKERLELLIVKQQSLNADFLNISDLAQRDLASAELLRLSDKIEDAREEVERTTQVRTDIEEEARRAGALPGWLRGE